ncbi:cell cycle regulator of non-homologous end joining isoform X4 [Phascolarctos cinereus]
MKAMRGVVLLRWLVFATLKQEGQWAVPSPVTLAGSSACSAWESGKMTNAQPESKKRELPPWMIARVSERKLVPIWRPAKRIKTTVQSADASSSAVNRKSLWNTHCCWELIRPKPHSLNPPGLLRTVAMEKRW